ncbi:putative membrane-associated protein [uncultured Pleomorphomonas sp.]|uniref:Putative membrane-associated protein n=1 Tax=uncultured Pleomorphomonas sp. TaxID=442121 RepID=A0A212LHF3_9HYPH|nr:periplasmic heavy metal sensor [uncultured Pleomorphomonas sp.]SCM76974.1 putative membrane-associated protein [uncultured Pleomorphomonas sp.]
MKIALALSLALNVFILGAAAGAWIWRLAPMPAQPADQGLASAAQAMAPDQRQAFRQALAKARSDAQPDSQAARDARDKLARLLKEADLDRDAIDATLETTRAADIRVRARVEAAVMDFAEGLDSQSRALLIDGLSSRGQILPHSAKK